MRKRRSRTSQSSQSQLRADSSSEHLAAQLTVTSSSQWQLSASIISSGMHAPGPQTLQAAPETASGASLAVPPAAKKLTSAQVQQRAAIAAQALTQELSASGGSSSSSDGSSEASSDSDESSSSETGSTSAASDESSAESGTSSSESGTVSGSSSADESGDASSMTVPASEKPSAKSAVSGSGDPVSGSEDAGAESADSSLFHGTKLMSLNDHSDASGSILQPPAALATEQSRSSASPCCSIMLPVSLAHWRNDPPLAQSPAAQLPQAVAVSNVAVPAAQVSMWEPLPFAGSAASSRDLDPDTDSGHQGHHGRSAMGADRSTLHQSGFPSYESAVPDAPPRRASDGASDLQQQQLKSSIPSDESATEEAPSLRASGRASDSASALQQRQQQQQQQEQQKQQQQQQQRQRQQQQQQQQQQQPQQKRKQRKQRKQRQQQVFDERSDESFASNLPPGQGIASDSLCSSDCRGAIMQEEHTVQECAILFLRKLVTQCMPNSISL